MLATTSGFRLINAEVKPLTRELAEEFRNLEASPTERALDVSHVKHLREKAEAGQLVTFNWSTAKLGSRKLRMNGMHSSTMLCGLNGSFPENLKVHLDTYEVDSPEALAVLFRQFDDRKSSAGSECDLVSVANIKPTCEKPRQGLGNVIDGLFQLRRFHVRAVAEHCPLAVVPGQRQR